MLFSYASLVLAGAGTVQAAHVPRTSKSITVKTSSGIFAALHLDDEPRLAVFPDIPYAQNPTGPLRFAPPVRATPSSPDPVSATAFPGACYQFPNPALAETVAKLVTSWDVGRGNYSTTTEDCLRLAVFAPRSAVPSPSCKRDSTAKDKTDPGSLPVIIFIHGGGFSFGAIDVPYFNPSPWVSRSQKHIVVSIQYRLALLGLPKAAGLAAQGKNLNLGFLDQRMAIEWVRDNIAQFGGDPHKIIIYGQSAGAYAVDAYSFTYKNDSIVKGAIVGSGNALLLPSFTVPSTDHSVFSGAASALECGGLEAQAELECMRSLPPEKFQSYLQGGGIGEQYGVVADNVTVFADYDARLAAGEQADYPLLAGTTADEGTIFAPLTADSIPEELVGQIKGFKTGLVCSTLRTASVRHNNSRRTFQYLYGGNFTNISPKPWLGAYHTSELPLVFGTFDLEGEATEFERQLSNTMQDSLVAFAQDPLGGLEKLGWTASTGEAGRREIMQWGIGGKLAELASDANLRNECA